MSASEFIILGFLIFVLFIISNIDDTVKKTEAQSNDKFTNPSSSTEEFTDSLIPQATVPLGGGVVYSEPLNEEEEHAKFIERQFPDYLFENNDIEDQLPFEGVINDLKFQIR